MTLDHRRHPNQLPTMDLQTIEKKVEQKKRRHICIIFHRLCPITATRTGVIDSDFKCYKNKMRRGTQVRPWFVFLRLTCLCMCMLNVHGPLQTQRKNHPLYYIDYKWSALEVLVSYLHKYYCYQAGDIQPSKQRQNTAFCLGFDQCIIKVTVQIIYIS